MSYRTKRLSVVILIAAMTIMLTACGASPKNYLSDYLNHAFHDEYSSSYLKLTGSTQEQAQQVYNQNLNEVCVSFLESLSLNGDILTDSTKTATANFIDKLYKQTRFNVESVKSDKNGTYHALISIEPVQFFASFPHEKITDLSLSAKDELDSLSNAGTLTADSANGISAKLAQEVINVFNSHLQNTTLLPAETITIQLVETDGILSLVDGELERIDLLLIR